MQVMCPKTLMMHVALSEGTSLAAGVLGKLLKTVVVIWILATVDHHFAVR
jgi:hypothetical protein